MGHIVRTMLGSEVFMEKQRGGRFAFGGKVWSRQAKSYWHRVVCLMIDREMAIRIGALYYRTGKTKSPKGSKSHSVYGVQGVWGMYRYMKSHGPPGIYTHSLLHLRHTPFYLIPLVFLHCKRGTNGLTGKPNAYCIQWFDPASFD
jgi:hypothetical protein